MLLLTSDDAVIVVVVVVVVGKFGSEIWSGANLWVQALGESWDSLFFSSGGTAGLFPKYLRDDECYSTCYFQMFFPIEIGTYLYILRLWWYDINYIIRILVSGVLVASKWPKREKMSTRQHRLRNEGRKWSLPTRCIQSVAKIIIENNTSLEMADVFRLLCICVFSNRYFLFHCLIFFSSLRAGFSSAWFFFILHAYAVPIF